MLRGSNNNLNIFILFLLLTSTNFLIFGMGYYSAPSGDSEHYNLYAQNIVSGNGYTMYSENGFSPYREPGYPVFLSSIYLLFGIENFNAVKIVQIILLAVTAFLVFKIFELFGYRRLGIIVGSIFAFLPLYAYQANLLQSELLTIFLLTGSFLITLTILKGDKNLKYYILLGIIFSLLGLTRAHMLLMPLILGLIFYWRAKPLKNIAVFLTIVVISILSWMTYVYSNTEMFAITKGRDDLHLYTRSIRATLSYGGQINYFKSWLKRSAVGGKDDEILNKYEPGPLIIEYGELVKNGKPEEEIRRESVARIKQNLGHYLFGNPMEILKMMFIEHLFPPVSSLLSRTIRAGIYLTIYSIFAGGVISYLFSKNKQLYILMNVGFIYIAYHWIILSFFDVIPRFNTPYLGLYLIIGIAGLARKVKS